MARVNSTKRADEVLAIYRDKFPEFNPITIHSDVPLAERNTRLEALHQRDSRILVCVDMFGEGFDLPQLKVAALHDRHKSLAITLQFVGRFTRDAISIGNARVVANTADEGMSDALRTLYAEDADWNHLLKILGEAATGRARKRAEVLEGFTSTLPDIPLQTLFPRMSAVVYRTTCEQWEPLKVGEAIPAARLYADVVVNPTANIAIFVTRDDEPVRWGSVKQIENVEWNLHVMHWNEDLQLLFINSSSKDFHERVAEVVCGSKDRVNGETMYRVLGRIRRLTLTNLGLSHALGKNIRYTMFMGADIADGLTEAAKFGRRKSNLFGLGYEDDDKVTIGCSSKGRLWSYKIAWDLSEWTDWCAHVGAKLLDDQISIDDVLAHVIKARRVTERPALVPVMISWPEEFLSHPEDRIELQVGSARAAFFECQIDAATVSDSGPLIFAVDVAGEIAQFELSIDDQRAVFVQIAGRPAIAVVRGTSLPLTDWFNQDPPIIHFANGDFLVFNELFELPQGMERISFDPTRIAVWDWTGIDIGREAQGPQKDPASIQRRTIEHALSGEFGNFDVLFDGDGKGEVADVVGLELSGRKLHVVLFHCKYSQTPAVGARIDDLYEVCGQAQKSVRWREDPRRMLRHLLHQEETREARGQSTRFERGTKRTVQQLLNMARELQFEYRVIIVQPGVSKSRVIPAFLDVLGATETFLRETYSMPFAAIMSA